MIGVLQVSTVLAPAHSIGSPQLDNLSRWLPEMQLRTRTSGFLQHMASQESNYPFKTSISALQLTRTLSPDWQSLPYQPGLANSHLLVPNTMHGYTSSDLGSQDLIATDSESYFLLSL